MTIHTIKLTDEKTILSLDDETGWLFEEGGDYVKFHRFATDARIIRDFLNEHTEAIERGYEREKALRAGTP